jgi:predicted nicotinamide N-methyase
MTNGDDDDEVDDEISLFEQESTDVLEIGELRFRQYNDEKWGIHSWVWDGGIALLQYVIEHWIEVATRDGERPLVIDLGSGTGVTGFGIAWYSQGKVSVTVTDLKEALPLLQENLELNQLSKLVAGEAPNVQELAWGAEIDEDWLRRITHGVQRVLITGADIVYRPSLFEPLASTLQKLDRSLKLCGVADIDIWFACQSVRTYLNEFWEIAAKYGFTAKLLASVQLGTKKTDLSLIQIQMSAKNDMSREYIQKADGLVLIVSLSKRF